MSRATSRRSACPARARTAPEVRWCRPDLRRREGTTSGFRRRTNFSTTFIPDSTEPTDRNKRTQASTRPTHPERTRPGSIDIPGLGQIAPPAGGFTQPSPGRARTPKPGTRPARRKTSALDACDVAKQSRRGRDNHHVIHHRRQERHRRLGTKEQEHCAHDKHTLRRRQGLAFTS